MSKYKAMIHFEGAFDYEIEATSKEEAEKIAQGYIDDLPSDSEIFADNLADCFIDDSWEITDEE